MPVKEIFTSQVGPMDQLTGSGIMMLARPLAMLLMQGAKVPEHRGRNLWKKPGPRVGAHAKGNAIPPTWELECDARGRSETRTQLSMFPVLGSAARL